MLRASLARLILAMVVGSATAPIAFSQDVPSAIRVVGNKRVEAVMVRSHFHAEKGDALSRADLDSAVKALYSTGYFERVDLSRSGAELVVTVVENSFIDRIGLEGNRKLKNEAIRKELRSRERAPLVRANVHEDVLQIQELYRRTGRFNVAVNPKLIEHKDNRVDLVFEITEGVRAGVRQIVFVGNKAYRAADLKGAIKTGETNLLSFYLENDVYDRERIEQDRERLRRFYLARGYADMAVVSAAAEYRRDENGIVLTFTVDEGAQYRIGTVEVASTMPNVPVDALRSQLEMKPGAVYNGEAAEKASDDLALALARKSEPFAAVRLGTRRVPDRRVINLVYTVEPGQRRYVERIDIRGNEKTKDYVIRRELDATEGDAFNAALLTRGERRLKNLGFFKNVRISSAPGSAPDRVVLNITVEEQKTGDFNVSGGYSTVDGMLAEVSVSDRNFLGRGEFAKAAVTYGQYSHGFDIAFIEPHFFESQASLGLGLFDKQRSASTYQSYDATTYGAKVALGTPLSDTLGAEWRYSLYKQSITLEPSIGAASLPIRQAALAGPMWVSSIGAGFTYSTLDNPRTPTTGVRAAINEDLAGLGGDAKFIRTTEDLRYYHEVADNVVGMVRAQGGYVAPWGGQELPLLNNFFGGPQMVRGFAPNGFGPRDLTPGTTMDNVGGNVYWATTAEFQAPVPLLPSEFGLKVAVFADAGSLWSTRGGASTPSLSSSLQVANSRTIRSSFGAGLVWDSMFGPITVDYAYPLTKASSDITQRVHFGALGF